MSYNTSHSSVLYIVIPDLTPCWCPSSTPSVPFKFIYPPSSFVLHPAFSHNPALLNEFSSNFSSPSFHLFLHWRTDIAHAPIFLFSPVLLIFSIFCSPSSLSLSRLLYPHPTLTCFLFYSQPSCLPQILPSLRLPPSATPAASYSDSDIITLVVTGFICTLWTDTSAWLIVPGPGASGAPPTKRQSNRHNSPKNHLGGIR